MNETVNVFEGIDLLPCPFCGCEHVAYEEYSSAVGNRWRAVCCLCGGSFDDGCAQSPRSAAAGWNRRTVLNCDTTA